MWLVVYVASSQEEAEKVKQLLTGEGILARLRPTGLAPAGPIEVLVPEGESEEAHEILSSALGR